MTKVCNSTWLYVHGRILSNFQGVFDHYFGRSLMCFSKPKLYFLHIFLIIATFFILGSFFITYHVFLDNILSFLIFLFRFSPWYLWTFRTLRVLRGSINFQILWLRSVWLGVFKLWSSLIQKLLKLDLEKYFQSYQD